MKHIDVLILMGSKSDLPTMQKTEAELTAYGVPYLTLIRSAHRMPEATITAVKEAEEAGCKVFVCAAGMAAHLAGVVASKTICPVIGVPIASGTLAGQDALHATVMMPPGIPVATVAINGAKNAALLAIQILATQDETLREKLQQYRIQQAKPVD
ncbi:MAG: 5-(carboxyamino)imidazole ribonucleotide mutase [Mariprofundaceae bacterium]|nr:5-(carboxyamino)imidazole ribonucleotide mutase [Mariprofundaceae bacterium]